MKINEHEIANFGQFFKECNCILLLLPQNVSSILESPRKINGKVVSRGKILKNNPWKALL